MDRVRTQTALHVAANGRRAIRARPPLSNSPIAGAFMTAPRYDVLGIGNAIVDVLARTGRRFPGAPGHAQGRDALIDEPPRRSDSMRRWVRRSRHPAARRGNTIAASPRSAAARLHRQGHRRRARQGLRPRHPRRRRHVRRTPLQRTGHPTARCYDPGDAGRRAHDEHLSRRRQNARRRTTSTKPSVATATITYLEGYLWDPPEAKDAFASAPPRSPTTPGGASR